MTGLAGAQAWAKSHPRDVALGAAGAGVAGLALYAKKKKATAAAASAGPAGTGSASTTSGAPVNSDGSQSVVGAGMDTTDLQNWVQDQLNQQYSALSAQYATATGSNTTGTAASTNPPPTGDNSVQYIRIADSSDPNAVYAVQNGVRTYLNAKAFAQLGNPNGQEQLVLSSDTRATLPLSNPSALTAAQSSPGYPKT